MENDIFTISEDFEDVSCNACGSSSRLMLFENIDRLHGFPGVFNINRCVDCGLIYVSPRPRDIGKYYLQSYEPYKLNPNDFYQRLDSSLMSAYYSDENGFGLWIKRRLYSLLCQPIPKQYSGKRILDLGCGNGFFLYNLKKYGWFDVYGVEMSPEASAQAKKELGLDNIRVGTLDNNVFEDNFFDVITLNHVIEHLTDPRKTLIEIKRILKPDGLIVITTPNAESLFLKIFGRFWFALETPRHLNLFSRNSLQRMLDSIGNLEIVNSKYQLSNYVFARSLIYRLAIKEGFIFNLLMKIKAAFYLVFWLIPKKKRDFATFYIKKNDSICSIN